MWASKLALRIIQFALAVAIIGCVGAILSPGLWTIYPLLVILPQVSLPSPPLRPVLFLRSLHGTHQ
jgi:hypothetical protein